MVEFMQQREYIVSSRSVADELLRCRVPVAGAVRASTKEGTMTIAVLKLHNELNLGIAPDATDHHANAIRLDSMMQMRPPGLTD